jgi:predicted ATP-binding protein involved in virulence
MGERELASSPPAIDYSRGGQREMKIHSLTMKNFRGFEDATLDLDRPLTVLFGVNGSGKSSVLGAIVVALSEALRQAGPERGAAWIHLGEDTDIRHGASDLALMATLSNGEVTKEIVIGHRRGMPRDVPGSSVPNGHLFRLYNAAPAVSVFYRASRDVAAARDAFALLENGSNKPALRPSSATDDSLIAGHLKFQSLFQWFKAREDVENEIKVSEQNLSLEDPQLSAVRRAIAGVLPGFSGLRIQRDPLHMVIRKGDATFAIDQLSDGEKLLLALTADLARRLAIAHVDHGDSLQGEAIVLIDEIELHLHPAWQRRVLASLRSTFPNCQLIVTTHSPQVLSEVPNEAVVLVEDFQFLRPGAPTAGRDSNAILAEVMGTPERAATQLGAIHAISTLLDEGKHAEARVKLDALARELSEGDREVVGLRTMLHFLEGADEAHSQGG